MHQRLSKTAAEGGINVTNRCLNFSFSFSDRDIKRFMRSYNNNSGFSSLRINLSPFTKDFRGEEHYNNDVHNSKSLELDL